MKVYKLYIDMLEQPHLLIAGATGSGKSVVINGLILTAMYDGVSPLSFILIDPKRVELAAYRHTRYCQRYASEPEEMVEALQEAMDEIDRRYRWCQQNGVKKYTESRLYVVIDELADLMTTNRKQVQPLIQRICQVGRAANVHMIAATQCPIAKVIPTEIKVNFDARVGLRTRSAQDSRNIIGFKGCERLPRYGQGYYMTPEGCKRWNLPMYTEEETEAMLAQAMPKHRGFFARLFGVA